jgi:hypothetical protein
VVPVSTSAVVLVVLLVVGVVAVVCAAFGAYAGGERMGRRRLEAALADARTDRKAARKHAEEAASAATQAQEAARDAQAAVPAADEVWNVAGDARALEIATERIGRLESELAELQAEIRRQVRPGGNDSPEDGNDSPEDDDGSPGDGDESSQSMTVEWIRSPEERVSETGPELVIVNVDFFVESGETDTARLVGVGRTVTVPTETFQDRVEDFLAEYSVDKVIEAGWPAVTEVWQVVDPGHFDRAAVGVEDANDLIHDLVLGRPAEAAAEALGLRSVPEAAAVDIVTALPLPVDRRFSAAVTAIRVTGAVAGVVMGHPALTLACVRSLARTAVTRLVADRVREVMSGPAGERQRGRIEVDDYQQAWLDRLEGLLREDPSELRRQADLPHQSQREPAPEVEPADRDDWHVGYRDYWTDPPSLNSTDRDSDYRDDRIDPPSLNREDWDSGYRDDRIDPPSRDRDEWGSGWP